MASSQGLGPWQTIVELVERRRVTQQGETGCSRRCIARREWNLANRPCKTLLRRLAVARRKGGRGRGSCRRGGGGTRAEGARPGPGFEVGGANIYPPGGRFKDKVLRGVLPLSANQNRLVVLLPDECVCVCLELYKAVAACLAAVWSGVG